MLRSGCQSSPLTQVHTKVATGQWMSNASQPLLFPSYSESGGNNFIMSFWEDGQLPALNRNYLKHFQGFLNWN